eukprot:scaffold53666_cov75-Phaeocystis_antarctica.AAC.1
MVLRRSMGRRDDVRVSGITAESSIRAIRASAMRGHTSGRSGSLVEKCSLSLRGGRTPYFRIGKIERPMSCFYKAIHNHTMPHRRAVGDRAVVHRARHAAGGVGPVRRSPPSHGTTEKMPRPRPSARHAPSARSACSRRQL